MATSSTTTQQVHNQGYLYHEPQQWFIAGMTKKTEVSMAHEVKSPENQPQFPRRQWSSIGKPKQAFRSTRKAAMEFYNKNYFKEFSTD